MNDTLNDGAFSSFNKQLAALYSLFSTTTQTEFQSGEKEKLFSIPFNNIGWEKQLTVHFSNQFHYKLVFLARFRLFRAAQSCSVGVYV